MLSSKMRPFQHQYASIISFQELYGSKGQPCKNKGEGYVVIGLKTSATPRWYCTTYELCCRRSYFEMLRNTIPNVMFVVNHIVEIWLCFKSLKINKPYYITFICILNYCFYYTIPSYITIKLRYK